MLPLLCLVLTIGIYWSAKRFYFRYPKIYLTPLLITPLIIILLLTTSNIPYSTYHLGTHWLSDMIGPATVALAVPVYKNFHILRQHAAAILSSVLFGSTLAVLSSAWIAKELDLSPQMIESLAPRSVTTPIAMAISQFMGGIPTVTAVIVMITGLLGMIIGPIIIKLFRIRNDVARGVLFGTGAHAAGTSKAFEFGTVAGSISSIAMVLTGLITLCTVSWVMGFIL